MSIQNQIADHNQQKLIHHKPDFEHLAELLTRRGIDVQGLLEKIKAFQVAIPSWALGTGGTRFGRFSIGGEPRHLEEKVEDVGLLHALNRSSNSISLHIPWDVPRDIPALKQLLAAHELSIDSVNSNTFQDQPAQALSYKYGSLAHTDAAVREQAIAHNIACFGLKGIDGMACRWFQFSGAAAFQEGLAAYRKRAHRNLSKTARRLVYAH